MQAVELQPGDEILVRTGEVFAADGVVSAGDGRVDESMLTGESTAIAKPGARRCMRARRTSARRCACASRPWRTTRCSPASSRCSSGRRPNGPRLAKAADRAAAWFLGRILLGAALVFVVWWFVDPSRAFPAALAVLVVTCPCALSLATPAAIAAATAALARRGVLVAHSDALEMLAKATHVLWDKTGTLTRGLIRIEEVRLARGAAGVGLPATRGRARAACRSIRSPGPSSRPAARRATASEVAVMTAARDSKGRSRAGGCVSAARLRARAWRSRAATCRPSCDGESWVYLGDADGLLAAFRLTDPLRAEAADCVARLAELGLASEIVSGDDAAAVARIAARSGIERFAARLTPASEAGAAQGAAGRRRDRRRSRRRHQRCAAAAAAQTSLSPWDVAPRSHRPVPT